MGRFPRLQHAVERAIEEGALSGAQVYVSIEQVPEVDIGIGTSTRGAVLTSATPTAWFCCTKPIASVALGQLHERHELRFDDAVCRYLPEFRHGGKQDVTLAQILTHTSGLVDGPAAALTTEPWEEILKAICASPLPPDVIPGRSARYSLAAGWFVLAEIVSRLDGRPFDRYVDEEIFGPLGMDSCSLGADPGESPVWRLREGRRGRHQPPSRPARGCNPGYGGVGPMRELGRFFESLLEIASGADGLLRPRTLVTLLYGWRVEMFEPTYGGPWAWGLGFIVDRRFFGRACSPKVFGHPGLRAQRALCDPEHQLVVALALVGLTARVGPLHQFTRLMQALYADLGVLCARP